MVFAKVRAARTRDAPSPGERIAEPRRVTWIDAALMVGLAAAGTAIWLRPAAVRRPIHPRVSQPPSTPAEASLPALEEPVEPPAEAPESSPAAVAPSPDAVVVPPRDASSFPPEDKLEVARLERVVGLQTAIEDADVRAAENLHARYPQMPAVAHLVERVLLLAARQAQAGGRTVNAGRLFTRATELLPNSPRVWPLLIQFWSGSRDWRETELAARRGLSARPEDGLIHRALAVALMRQDRNDEAAEVLRRALAQQDDHETRSLLDRLQGELDSSRGMAQRTSSHFRVRFEGEPDDALGAALVRMLEEKYAMLARIFSYEPSGEIPVILYPMETFRSVTSAPDWAGANYSHFDGRIRIGTRGISAGFVPLDLERTITHELVHAFVAGRSGGNAPREINEGLAQYHSGRRLGYRLARSRVSESMNVVDFYDASLSFVEYLLDKYRQSSMNELLALLGEKGTHEAFRRAYGQGYQDTRAEWIRQLD